MVPDRLTDCLVVVKEGWALGEQGEPLMERALGGFNSQLLAARVVAPEFGVTS
jgi:hypothetical protein